MTPKKIKSEKCYKTTAASLNHQKSWGIMGSCIYAQSTKLSLGGNFHFFRTSHLSGLDLLPKIYIYSYRAKFRQFLAETCKTQPIIARKIKKMAGHVKHCLVATVTSYVIGSALFENCVLLILFIFNRNFANCTRLLSFLIRNERN